MKDLYRHLGIEPDASDADIRRAIERASISPSLRNDATTVLLDARARAVYDRHRGLLLTISTLRAATKLEDSIGWAETYRSEFPPAIPEMATPPRSPRPSPPPPVQPIGVYAPRRSPAQQSAWSAAQPEVRPKVVLITLIVAGAIIGLVALISAFEGDGTYGPDERAPQRELPAATAPSSVSPRRPAAAPAVNPDANLFAAPRPPHGPTGRFGGPPADGVAPFEIRAPFGQDVLARISTFLEKQDVVELYIHGGRSLEVLLPLGTYELRYAIGSKWYGFDDLFGSQTQYQKAKDTFRLRETRDAYEGVSIELVPQVGGNLATGRLKPGEF